MSRKLQWTLIYIIWTFFIGSASTQGHLVRIDLRGKSQEDLARTGLAFDHGQYKPGEYFTGDFSPAEQKKLLAAGFSFKAVSALDIRTPFTDCHQDNVTPPDYEIPLNYEYGSMGGFLTLDEMYANLDLMHELYPQLVTVRTKIGNFRTEEGRPLYYLKISDRPGDAEAEPQVLYTALHHAREPASMSQMLFFMWYLLENYNRNAEVRDLVNSRELYFVPCVNPDGYRYNQTTNPTGRGYWRKNRTVNSDNTYGIDLNRNYGYKWAFNDIGSSPNGEAETYRGEDAFSEIETQAMREFCRQHDFNIAVNYHTFGNILIIPWGYSDSPTADNEEFKLLANEFTRYNHFTVGTATSTLNYQVNGVSDDWMYGDTSLKKKIFSFTPEIGGAFWPTRQEIIQINQQAQYMNFSAAWNAGSVARISESSPGMLEPVEGDLRAVITRTGIVDGEISITVSCDHPDQVVIDQVAPLHLSMAETRVVKIRYHLVKPLPFQEKIQFTLNVRTGEFGETIQASKLFIGTPYWRDQAGNTGYWTSNINRPFEVTQTDYDSAPSCFTDSPEGARRPNQSYLMTTSEPVDLQRANYGFLSFKLRYDLDPDEDYAQVLISSDGNQFYPVCGRYSVNGNFLQGVDQPVYAGASKQWLTEWIDLRDFLGQRIWLQIKMGTGSKGQHDGFYIDDLRIYADLVSATGEPAGVSGIYPNPAGDLLWISDPSQEIAQIRMLNTLGEEEPVTWSREGERILCLTGALPAGFYTLEMNKGPFRREVRKIIIQH